MLGIFLYYAQWLPKLSEKIKPLIVAMNFPLGEKDVQALNLLKNDLASAALQIIDKSIPFEMEIDASENAVSTTLNQNNRPVAFFSSSLKVNFVILARKKRLPLLWKQCKSGLIFCRAATLQLLLISSRLYSCTVLQTMVKLKTKKLCDGVSN